MDNTVLFARLAFGFLSFLAVIMSLSSPWYILPIHIIAGIIAAIMVFGPGLYRDWNLAKTGTITAFIIFGFAALFALSTETLKARLK